MARAVQSPARLLDAYANIVGAAGVSRIRSAARPLQGARVLHISASASSTHHARLVSAAVALLREVGIDARLMVPDATEDDLLMANGLYQAIQGEGDPWKIASSDAWRRYARGAASRIQAQFDVVIVHDPQLLPMRRELQRRSQSTRWIWHCHLDLSDSDELVARLLSDVAAGFDLVALEHPRFAGDVRMPRKVVIPPAIDPLSPRNSPMRLGATDAILHRFHIAKQWPFAVQVSRFDGWDDPRWAIYTFDAARKLLPDIQFVLISTSAAGDVELHRLAREMPRDRIRYITSAEAGDLEVNALQGAACAAMQHGVRKGYSPALLDASWKGRPVLAGEGGPLSDQVVQGQTGYVFKTFDEAACRLAQLVKEPTLADVLGFEGHRRVRENNLVVRWMEEYLNLMTSIGQPA